MCYTWDLIRDLPNITAELHVLRYQINKEREIPYLRPIFFSLKYFDILVRKETARL
jgi:fructoselysine-6-P-deglycase FrlB-like protein